VRLVSKKVEILLITFMILILLNYSLLLNNNCHADGNTIYVDDSGGADYTEIQDAVNAASEDDIIYVYSGTYENILIEGSVLDKITLIGENRDTTIIDGGNSGHVIRAFETQVSGNKIEIHISGFTIKNAGGNGFDCVSISYAENSTIMDNKILNGDVGEGIQLDHCSEITIQDNIITSCQGSGISLSVTTESIIDNNLIQNNQKGIHLSSNSNYNIISNNTIKSHTQYGVYIIQSTGNRIYYNDFTDNDQNAQDSLTNYWSYNSKGNYWDDYTGYDYNNDDIGDTPYDIPGDVNQDNYPLGYFQELEEPAGNQQPTAYLPSISPNPANFGDTIEFTGSGSDSDGFIEGYSWRSNIDGHLSSQSSFSKSSLSIGTHSIYFKVQDNEGTWSSEKSQTLDVKSTVDQEPTAIIDSVIPNPTLLGEKISFIGHGSDDGIITDWKWISSLDGLISSSKSFDYYDLSEGIHTIYFQVMDDSNQWSKQDSEMVMVYSGSVVPYSTLPVANAGGPYTCNINKEVVFNASDSYDDGFIVDYFWDFGDGYYGSGELQSHIYEKDGNYSIILTVTDNDGNTSTDITYISVFNQINEESGSEGLLDINLDIPFPVIVAIEFLCVIVVIAAFFSWIRKK